MQRQRKLYSDLESVCFTNRQKMAVWSQHSERGTTVTFLCGVSGQGRLIWRAGERPRWHGEYMGLRGTGGDARPELQSDKAAATRDHPGFVQELHHSTLFVVHLELHN